MLLHLKRVAVGAFLFGGIGFVCAYLNFVERAVVFGVAVVLAFLNGAFDRGICVAAAGRIFHEKSVLSNVFA